MRTAPSPDDIDITELWRAVRRSLPRVLLATALMGALTFGALSLMVKKYGSEAQLAIVAKGASNPFADPKRDSAPELLAVPVDKEAINTHVRALQSADLATRVAADLGLAGRAEFNSALGAEDTIGRLMRAVGLGGPRPGESETDRVLSAYYRGLDVYSPKESRLIGIRFTSSDPALAAEIANHLAALYRERLASVRVTETDDLQKVLQPKIARLADEVAAAEAEVERFKASANLFKVGPQSTGLNEQQLGELTAELTRAKAARSEAEARAKAARELMQREAGDVAPDVQRSPLIQNLVQQRVRVERQIFELSATLLPAHPRMQQLTAELNGLKRQIAAEASKIVSGLEKEAGVAALREDSIRKSLDEIKTRVVMTGTDEVKLRQIEANARSKRAELERLQAQFEANRARSDSGSVPVEAQIVSAARPSSVPSSPRKGPYTALVMVATLLFGTAWSLTRALITGARRRGTMKKVAAELRLPLASGAPVHPTAVLAEAQAALTEGLDLSAPAALARIPRLRTVGALARHLLGAPTQPGGFRSIMVGDGPGVDAAADALELSRALAAGGANVVLVDWSADERPPLTAAPGVKEGHGIKELLEGAVSFEDVVRRDTASAVQIIAAGCRTDDTAVLRDADRINLVLDALDEVYDHIIVTGPYEPVRALFETIEGRFDAGITVADPRRRVLVGLEPANTFLGFEVTEIELLRYERRAAEGLRPAPAAAEASTEAIAG